MKEEINWKKIKKYISFIESYIENKRKRVSMLDIKNKKILKIICKVCNPTAKGNRYCASHSTSGKVYLDSISNP